jgi:hypothetical protein
MKDNESSLKREQGISTLTFFHIEGCFTARWYWEKSDEQFGQRGFNSTFCGIPLELILGENEIQRETGVR